MKVINVSGGPLYCSYAKRTMGGTVLQNGQASAELELATVHTELIWKDIQNSKMIMRLSDKDREFIAQLLKEDRRPAPRLTARPKVLVPPPEIKRERRAAGQPRKTRAQWQAEKLAAKAAALAAIKHTPGIPKFDNGTKSTVKEILHELGDRPRPEMKSAIPNVVVQPDDGTRTYGRPPSIADLQRENENAKAK